VRFQVLRVGGKALPRVVVQTEFFKLGKRFIGFGGVIPEAVLALFGLQGGYFVSIPGVLKDASRFRRFPLSTRRRGSPVPVATWE
jgi:hypothetical protein